MGRKVQKKFTFDEDDDADVLAELSQGPTEIFVVRESISLRRQRRLGNDQPTLAQQLRDGFSRITNILERIAQEGVAIAGPVELGLKEEDTAAIATLLGNFTKTGEPQ